jgi:hypothetical protein
MTIDQEVPVRVWRSNVIREERLDFYSDFLSEPRIEADSEGRSFSVILESRPSATWWKDWAVYMLDDMSKVFPEANFEGFESPVEGAPAAYSEGRRAQSLYCAVSKASFRRWGRPARGRNGAIRRLRPTALTARSRWRRRNARAIAAARPCCRRCPGCRP